ncbi:MAG: SDR family oxidoreductase [Bacteroidia bacterium]|nr:SDR family oxidoreductase [Bacteroidia bacterium]
MQQESYPVKYHDIDLSKHSFLVTGGAGFIGSNVVEYLLKYGAGKVRVFDNLSNGFYKNVEIFLDNPNYEFIEGDIQDLDKCMDVCNGIDYLSHQAALGSVPRSIEHPIGTHNSNVTGFLNMLIAARDKGIKRMVYASSSSVYGDSKVSPKVEELTGKPLSPYAVSKVTNEYYADIFSFTYNMSIIGLRYFNVFGPRQDPNGPYAAAIPIFMNALLNDSTAYINGDGKQTRDFTFVENAVQANIRAMLTKNEGADNKVYNVAVGENASINDLYNRLKELSGSSATAVHRDDRPGDVKDSLADISRAREFLNYEPRVKLNEGLGVTYNWFSKTFAPVKS